MSILCAAKEKTIILKSFQKMSYLNLSKIDFQDIFIKYSIESEIKYKKITLPNKIKQVIKNFLAENYARTGLITAVVSPFSAPHLKDVEYVKYSKGEGMVFFYNNCQDSFSFNIIGITHDIIETNPYVYADKFRLSDEEFEMYDEFLSYFRNLNHEFSFFLIYYSFIIESIYFSLFIERGKINLLITFDNYVGLYEGGREIRIGRYKVSVNDPYVYYYHPEYLWHHFFKTVSDKELWKSAGDGKLLEITFNVFTFSLEPFLIKMMKRLIINIFKNRVKPIIAHELEKNISYFKCTSNHKTVLLSKKEEEKNNEAHSYSSLFLNVVKNALNGYSEKITNVICELITLGRYYEEEEIELSQGGKIKISIGTNMQFKARFLIRRKEIQEFFSIMGFRNEEIKFLIATLNLDVLRYSQKL